MEKRPLDGKRKENDMSMENDTRLMMMHLRDRARHSAPVRRNHSIRRQGAAAVHFALSLLTRLV